MHVGNISMQVSVPPWFSNPKQTSPEVQNRGINAILFSKDAFFKKFMGDTSPFCGATDTPVLFKSIAIQFVAWKDTFEFGVTGVICNWKKTSGGGGGRVALQ